MALESYPNNRLVPQAEVQRATITPRALFVGLAMAAAVCGIVAWAEYVTGTIMIGFLQIPPVAVALLFVVVLANRLVGWLWPRMRLRPAELTVIYIMMVFAAMITSRGLTEDLYATQVGLSYYANPANHWQKLFFASLKPSLVPWDPNGEAIQPVVKYYFEGLPMGTKLPWQPWLLPTGLWLILVGLVYTAFMGMAAIVYKLWADEEHLPFPLTKLPLELVAAPDGKADFLRNKLMWFGVLLPVIYFGLNGLHQIWPQFPEIKVRYRLLSEQAPWTSMGYTEMWFSLAGVGFFYLLSSEILFSLWFFFLLARFQEVLAGAVVGPPPGGGHAAAAMFVADETAGVSFMLVGLMVYIAWVRVRDIWRRQAQGDPAAANALLSFRTSALLVGLALIGIVFWWRWAGGSIAVALVEFGVYLFVQAIIMARATSEAGTLMTEGSFTPSDVWSFFGHRTAMGRTNLTLLSFSNALFSRDLRGLPLTGMLDSQALADGVRLSRRKIVPVILLVLVFAILLSGGLHLWISYDRGGAGLYSYIYRGNNIQFWKEYTPIAEGVEQYRPARPLWFTIGAMLCLLLGMLRRLYVWWPLHPLGAALSVTWIMCVFWFPALVAWLLKTGITRYGGLKGYTRLRPFFLGLIFGEFFMAVFWTVISFIFQTTAPMFPWP